MRPPFTLTDAGSGQRQVLAEIKLYGDCVLRFVSGDYEVGGWARLGGCVGVWVRGWVGAICH